MFNGIFYFVFNMSIISAFLIIVLLMVRALLGKWLKKTVFFTLWGIALIRLLIPVSFTSELSLINLLNSFFAKTVYIPKAIESMPNLSIVNSIGAANEYFPITYHSKMVERIFTLAGSVWLIGVAILSIFIIVMYWITVTRMKEAVLVNKNDLAQKVAKSLLVNAVVPLYQSKAVSSPVVVGILKPRIILPVEISDPILEFALLHEYAHIKRHDNLFRFLSIASVCIHWFNPFVWIFLFFSGRDMEFACDEKVLKNLSSSDRKSYAVALASLASKQQVVLTGFGSSAVKARIVNIINYQRMSIVMTLFTSLLCISLMIMLLTNPI